MKADNHSHHHLCLATALCTRNVSGNHNRFTPLGKQSQGRERGPIVVNDVKRTHLVEGSNSEISRTEEIEFHYSRQQS